VARLGWEDASVPPPVATLCHSYGRAGWPGTGGGLGLVGGLDGSSGVTQASVAGVAYRLAAKRRGRAH
jgi:hypothetical protein